MPASQDLSPLTFGNEADLPRVPLPTVDESCARLLAWCEPLLDADELATTAAAVAAFAEPAGPLQAALQAYDAEPSTHSWLDAFWAERYLGRRDRIALNANFFFLFQDNGESQVDRAASIVAGAVAYKLLIDAEQLPPALQRGRPLSMEQNKFLFSSTRIPGDVQDTARTPYSGGSPGPSAERHILVLHRGNAFRLDVIGPDGRPHALEDLAAGVRAVLDAAASPGSAAAGPLTSKARAAWAASRRQLLDADPRNAETLDVLERALFCLCLEDAVPADALAACDQLLAGDSFNRWFDKSVSFVVFPDGTAGYNGEHCKLDGTTVIGMIDAILNAPGEEHARAAGAEPQGTPAVAALDFVLDDVLRADVQAAADDFAAFAAATATVTVSVDFTSERAKALGVSPDAFAQMSYQLAHQRAKGHVGATYESIATRSFRDGRTEAMRVVTPEVAAFVAAMTDPAADPGTRRQALRAAAEQHVARAKECQAGLAPEQHLWELQMIQRRRGAELGVDAEPQLYRTPGWLTMRDDYLSTSAVPSSNVRFWGFGATSQKCIGVAYAMLPDRFDLYLSTPRSVSGAMERFAAELPGVVAELEALLSGED